MGGSSTECTQKILNTHGTTKFDLSCPNGQNAYMLWDQIEFGIMSAEIGEKIYCSNNALQGLISQGVEDCSSQMDK